MLDRLKRAMGLTGGHSTQPPQQQEPPDSPTNGSGNAARQQHQDESTTQQDKSPDPVTAVKFCNRGSFPIIIRERGGGRSLVELPAHDFYPSVDPPEVFKTVKVGSCLQVVCLIGSDRSPVQVLVDEVPLTFEIADEHDTIKEVPAHARVNLNFTQQEEAPDPGVTATVNFSNETTYSPIAIRLLDSHGRPPETVAILPCVDEDGHGKVIAVENVKVGSKFDAVYLMGNRNRTQAQVLVDQEPLLFVVEDEHDTEQNVIYFAKPSDEFPNPIYREYNKHFPKERYSVNFHVDNRSHLPVTLLYSDDREKALVSLHGNSTISFFSRRGAVYMQEFQLVETHPSGDLERTLYEACPLVDACGRKPFVLQPVWHIRPEEAGNSRSTANYLLVIPENVMRDATLKYKKEDETPNLNRMISFREEVSIQSIPSHRCCDKSTKQDLWNGMKELKEMTRRNQIEVAAEKCCWKEAWEEDRFVRLENGEWTHPATFRMKQAEIRKRKKEQMQCDDAKNLEGGLTGSAPPTQEAKPPCSRVTSNQPKDQGTAAATLPAIKNPSLTENAVPVVLPPKAPVTATSRNTNVPNAGGPSSEAKDESSVSTSKPKSKPNPNHVANETSLEAKNQTISAELLSSGKPKLQPALQVQKQSLLPPLKRAASVPNLCNKDTVSNLYNKDTIGADELKRTAAKPQNLYPSFSQPNDLTDTKKSSEAKEIKSDAQPGGDSAAKPEKKGPVQNSRPNSPSRSVPEFEQEQKEQLKSPDASPKKEVPCKAAQASNQKGAIKIIAESDGSAVSKSEKDREEDNLASTISTPNATSASADITMANNTNQQDGTENAHDAWISADVPPIPSFLPAELSQVIVNDEKNRLRGRLSKRMGHLLQRFRKDGVELTTTYTVTKSSCKASVVASDGKPMVDVSLWKETSPSDRLIVEVFRRPVTDDANLTRRNIIYQNIVAAISGIPVGFVKENEPSWEVSTNEGSARHTVVLATKAAPTKSSLNDSPSAATSADSTTFPKKAPKPTTVGEEERETEDFGFGNNNDDGDVGSEAFQLSKDEAESDDDDVSRTSDEVLEDFKEDNDELDAKPKHPEQYNMQNMQESTMEGKKQVSKKAAEKARQLLPRPNESTKARKDEQAAPPPKENDPTQLETAVLNQRQKAIANSGKGSVGCKLANYNNYTNTKVTGDNLSCLRDAVQMVLLKKPKPGQKRQTPKGWPGEDEEWQNMWTQTLRKEGREGQLPTINTLQSLFKEYFPDWRLRTVGILCSGAKSLLELKPCEAVAVARLHYVQPTDPVKPRIPPTEHAFVINTKGKITRCMDNTKDAKHLEVQPMDLVDNKAATRALMAFLQQGSATLEKMELIQARIILSPEELEEEKLAKEPDAKLMTDPFAISQMLAEYFKSRSIEFPDGLGTHPKLEQSELLIRRVSDLKEKVNQVWKEHSFGFGLETNRTTDKLGNIKEFSFSGSPGSYLLLLDATYKKNGTTFPTMTEPLLSLRNGTNSDLFNINTQADLRSLSDKEKSQKGKNKVHKVLGSRLRQQTGDGEWITASKVFIKAVYEIAEVVAD